MKQKQVFKNANLKNGPPPLTDFFLKTNCPSAGRNSVTQCSPCYSAVSSQCSPCYSAVSSSFDEPFTRLFLLFAIMPHHYHSLDEYTSPVSSGQALYAGDYLLYYCSALLENLVGKVLMFLLLLFKLSSQFPVSFSFLSISILSLLPFSSPFPHFP